MDTDTRSLVSMRAFNSVEHGGQTTATFLFTPENKRNVGRCWRRCLMAIKLCSTSGNIVQHGGQRVQLWTILYPFGLVLTNFFHAQNAPGTPRRSDFSQREYKA